MQESAVTDMGRETGNARDEMIGRVVTVDRSACIPCGACCAVCPREALTLEGMTLVVISERCRPCGQAALVCPTGALRCPGAEKR